MLKAGRYRLREQPNGTSLADGRRFCSHHGSPLVLAGVDYLLPIYREVSDYPHTLDEGVTGNPSELGADELHRRAWDLMVPEFRRERGEAAERFGDLLGTGRASGQLQEVVPAAVDGRVDTLFVPSGVRRWGRFDREQRSVEHHEEQGPESENLLDLTAVHTYLNGGTVYAVAPEEVPGDGNGEVAAVFRY